VLPNKFRAVRDSGELLVPTFRPAVRRLTDCTQWRDVGTVVGFVERHDSAPAAIVRNLS